jgi:hypothetical protein
MNSLKKTLTQFNALLQSLIDDTNCDDYSQAVNISVALSSVLSCFDDKSKTRGILLLINQNGDGRLSKFSLVPLRSNSFEISVALHFATQAFDEANAGKWVIDNNLVH